MTAQSNTDRTINLRDLYDYTVAPNMLLQMIVKRELSQAETALVMCILRHTLGFKDIEANTGQVRKLWNEISLKKFQSETGLARRHVVANLNRLRDKHVIQVEQQKYLSTGDRIRRGKNLYRIHPSLFVVKEAK